MSDVTDLKSEVLLLRQENVELHAEQAHWELGNCPNCPNIADLKEALEQNSKLRELVSGLEHCAGGFECNSCPLYDPSGTNHRRCESLEQELGIEVD